MLNRLSLWSRGASDSNGCFLGSNALASLESESWLHQFNKSQLRRQIPSNSCSARLDLTFIPLTCYLIIFSILVSLLLNRCFPDGNRTDFNWHWDLPSHGRHRQIYCILFSAETQLVTIAGDPLPSQTQRLMTLLVAEMDPVLIV